ncbi:MAG TPA: hypothetical protein VHD56_12550 [Tepidisphaeraceae bacterium]|nr:hypothetical protein [Tepidisphaeraceae bacterium]
MRHLISIAFIVVSTGAAALAAPFTGVYVQDFNSMGTGTSVGMPSGWTEFSLSGGHDDFRHAGSTAQITTTVTPAVSSTALNTGPTGSASTSQHTALAFATNDPSGTSFRSTSASNFASSSNPNDRALGTSPTGDAANELQLTLTNNTAAGINSIAVGYDIRRFSTTVDANNYTSSPDVNVEEFPGFWLFYSLDGGANWTNAATLNPTLGGPGGIVVPNSIGVTSVPLTTIDLSGTWNVGANLLLRWFDDNAQSPSPDQYLGLDNVSVVPEPATASLALLVVTLGAIRRGCRIKPFSVRRSR